MHQPLPQQLRHQLDAFRHRLFTQEALLTAAVIIGSIVASLVLLFLLDRFFETPRVLRVTLFAVSLLVAALSAWRWLHNWVFYPRDDRKLSLLVQKKYKKLGDTLLGAIELAEGRIQDDTLSPELRQAAIGSVAKQASAFDFVQAVNWQKTLRIGGSALAGGAAFVALGLFCFPALRATLMRWLNPLASTERFTFVKFNPLESPRIVPSGEPFDVTWAFAQDSQWQPRLINYQVGQMKAGLGINGAPLQVSGVTEKVSLNLWAGDGRISSELQPEPRPTLQKILASIALPDYLQLPPLSAKVTSSLTVVEGARVSFAGEASRDLQTFAAQNKGVAVDAHIHGQSFELSPVLVDKDTQLSMSWVDVFKLSGSAAHEVMLKTRPDEVPQVTCTNLGPSVGILEGSTLTIPFQAQDDFGVKNVSAHVRYAMKKSKDILGDKMLPIDAQGAPDQAQMQSEFIFCAKLQGIPAGSVVEFEACASDYCKDHLGRSEKHTITILTKEEHAKEIQNRLSDLANKMAELSAKEDERQQITKELSKQDDKALMSPETTQKLTEQEASEKEDKKALEALDKEVQELAAEAVKNEDMPKDVLSKMADISKLLEADADSESQPASDDLQSAQGEPDPSKRKEKIKKAQEHQKKIVDDLNKVAKKAEELQHDLDAQSFVNRFKKEAAHQLDRVNKANQMYLKNPGAKFEDLPTDQKEAIVALADAQTVAKDSVHVIGSDLAASFERSHKEVLNEVAQAMDKEKVDARNEKMIEKTNLNRLGTVVTEGKKLAALYSAWAEKLKGDDGGGGGGGGSGESESLPAEVLQTLMALIEGEQDLRTETRTLNTPEMAQLVAISQKELMGTLEKMAYKYTHIAPEEAQIDLDLPAGLKEFSHVADGLKPLPPKLLKLLAAVDNAMHDAQILLEDGKAKAPTIAAETEAIELLASIFKEGSGSGKGKGGVPIKMLATAMQQGSPSKSPGKGSTGNGTASNANDHTTHTSDDAARTSDKATGLAAGVVPEEFRSDIESYDRAFDQLEGGKNE